MRYKWTHGLWEDLSKEKQIEVLEEIIEHDSKNPRYSWNSGVWYDPSSQYDDKTVPSVAFLLDGKNVNPKVMLEHLKKSAVMNAETFNAPTGYTERGPRPFYGNPRKMALDRWGNRRFIRRRKDGTYMKNVDVGRSLAMDRRRQSQTWAPAGYRDQGDGSPSLLVRLLDMFRGVDEEILMAESYLMCADCDTYSSECGCHNSESDAYIYAYNDGHSDGRSNSVRYRPSTSDRELNSFKKIFKQ